MLFVEVVIPILLVLLGLLLSKIRIVYDSPERELSPLLFPLKQQLLVNSNLIRLHRDRHNKAPRYNSDGEEIPVESDDDDDDSEEDEEGRPYDIQPSVIIQNLPYYKEAFEVEYKDYSV